MENPWVFLPFGYFFSILIETPILLVGLSPRHPMSRRFFAGLWLTACTYPIVVIVLPLFWDLNTERFTYLLVAETFAPMAECLLFWLAFGCPERKETLVGAASYPTEPQGAVWPDMVTIVVANLASFGLGELMIADGFWLWLNDWLGALLG